MQVWTVASGKTARIATGKPLSPSTTSRMSSTSRLRSSFMTGTWRLRSARAEADDLLLAVGPDAQRDVDGLVADHPLVRDLTRSASKKTSG